MRLNKGRHVALILQQPGAMAFFEPVLPRLRDAGWMVTLNPDAMPEDVSVVVTSTSGAARERAAITEAGVRSVPRAQLIDSWYDYRYRIETTNGPARLPESLWLFDDVARDDAVAEGLPGERMTIVGNPAWEDAAPLPAAPESNALLVDQPAGADMAGRTGYDEAGFLRLVLDSLGGSPKPEHKLFFLPHPRREAPAALPAGANIQTIHDAKDALRLCGTVIGMFSSLLIDAFLAGRKVISVQPGAGRRDYCVLSRLGLVPRVTETRQFTAALHSGVAGPGAFRERFSGSSLRVMKALEELAGAGSPT